MIDIAGLQNPKTGAFAGDEWGEEDTRFIYTAINALSLLGRLDAVNVDAAVNYVLRCQNYDGGFGVMPDAESHSGQSMFLTPASTVSTEFNQFVFLKLFMILTTYYYKNSLHLSWCSQDH